MCSRLLPIRKNMDAKISFGKVHIVEWLPPGEAKTGWELFDELQPIGLASKPCVDVAFKRVRTRAELVAHIRDIQEDFRATRKLPLLHIEAHGFLDGICSSAGDEMLWAELMNELIPLNRLTGLRLFVVIAACEGLWGMQMLQPVERAAFLALLGPNERISAGHLSKACLAFYRGMFHLANGNAAFKAMNEMVNPLKPQFGMVNAEMLFKHVYCAFLKELCTKAEITRRVDRLVAENARQFKAEFGVGMWAHEVAHMREFVRQHVEAHNEHFQRFRRQFFFIDLFPENDDRFPITIEDCFAASDRDRAVDSGKAG